MSNATTEKARATEGGLLTARRLADYLAVTVRTVWRLALRGLPYVRVMGHRRFDLAAVRAWLERQAAAPARRRARAKKGG